MSIRNYASPPRRAGDFCRSPPSNFAHCTEARVSVRVDQPVVGVEVNVHAFFKSKDGNIDDTNVNLVFIWSKSNTARTCGAADCPHNVHIHPGAHKAGFSCIMCARLNLPLNSSCFCSMDCFSRCWKTHKQLHESHPKFQQLITPKERSEKERYPSKTMELWTEIGSQRTYTPTEADEGYILRVECLPLSLSGERLAKPTFVETNVILPVPPMHPPRLVTLNNRVNRTAILQSSGSFKVLTYNILAEIYATRQMYPYCPMWAMNWKYRRNLVMNELDRYDADILCLQEVQADYFESFLCQALDARGYDCLFKQKTRDAMGMEGKVDGCALFYKRNVFALAESHHVEFNEATMEFATSQLNAFRATAPNASAGDKARQKAKKTRRQQRLLRDNIAQIAVLQLLQPNGRESQRICVANTHIFSNPEFPDVKLWQANVLIQELQQFAALRRLPIILCGDFNSEPSSAVYQLLDKNIVTSEHPDFSKDPGNIFISNSLSHQMALSSAYATVMHSEPAYTNFPGHWVGTVDYVWYSREQLVPLSVYALHDPATLKAYAHTELPNCQFPSDHVSLCVEFSLIE